MGPTTRPRFATKAQIHIIQTRSRELNMSSTLPTTMVLGIAERNPLSIRPKTTPLMDGTAAMITQQMLYVAELMIYSFFRPKHSEYGGRMMPPRACPSKYLQVSLARSSFLQYRKHNRLDAHCHEDEDRQPVGYPKLLRRNIRSRGLLVSAYSPSVSV